MGNQIMQAPSETGRPEGSSYLPRFGLDQRWQFNLFDPDGTRAECMQPKAGPGKD